MGIFSSDRNKDSKSEREEHTAPPEDQPQTNRRKNQRFKVDLPARVEVLIHDATTRPSLKGIVQNISIGGVMVMISDANRELFRELTASQRFAKLHMELQTPPVQTKIIGRVVWVDYRDKDLDRPYCIIGVCFEKLFPAEEKQLKEILSELENKPPATP